MTPLPGPQEPIRVLFLAHYFPKPGNPLMGNWALGQAKALQRHGMEVSVLSFTSWIPRLAGRVGVRPAWSLCPPQHDWDGLHVEYPRWPIYFRGPIGRLTRRDPCMAERIAFAAARPALAGAVERFQPHITFAHHTIFNGCLARRLKSRFGIPYVITDHAFGEIAECERYPHRHATYAATVNEASAWIAVSKRMQRLMDRLFPAAAARTIHNGSEPVPESLLQRPRPSEIQGRRVVFSAGFFYPRKGFPLLIRAFAQVAPKYPDAVLRIGGDGADRAEVERALHECGLGADRVQLLGMLPPVQVRQEMAWADIFALIAWNEPFATVFIEAASAGRPIVWARDGGINDVLDDGVHGVSVEPQNMDSAVAALDQLLADDAGRERMGRATRDLFDAQLTWGANARAMRKIFTHAITTGAGQP